MEYERSSVYFGRTAEGTYVTLEQYVNQLSGIKKTPDIHCQRCHQSDGEIQPLRYDSRTNRFVHTNVNRKCFKDERSSRDHHLVQQAIFVKLANHPRYREVELEYHLKPNHADVRAEILYPVCESMAVEVNHACGNFKSRVGRKIRVAFENNHGFHVVFTPEASGKSWFERAVNQLMNEEYTAGTYDGGVVELGTLIRPDEFKPCCLYSEEASGILAD